jgi:hypothetical protein
VAVIGTLAIGSRGRPLLPVISGTPTPTPTTYLGPIETGNALLGSTAAGVTTGQARQYTVHTVRGSGTGITVTASGVEWDPMIGEVLLPAYDLRAAIEFPLGSGTFGTVATVTVAANDRYQDLVVDSRSWTDGQQFGLYVWASGTRLPTIGAGGNINTQLYTDEACEVAASVTQTPTNVPTDSLSRRRRLCVIVGIFSNIPLAAKTIAAGGDSIMAYQTANLAASSATSDHVRGDVVRSLSQYYACINLGIGGDQPSTALYTDRTLQRMLARRCSHLFDEFGVNEVENRQIDGAQAWAFHLRMRESFPTLKYAHSTLVPRTTGTWADEAGQTADATKTPRINAYNVLALAASDQTWNRRALIQGVDTDKWAAGYALDGLHPTLTAQTAIIADKATGKAKVDAATNPAGSQPAMTLTLTGTPTFASGKFTRGTATLDGAAASGIPSSMEFYGTAALASGFDVLCGAAGRLYVDASGFPTYTRQSTGTQYRAGVPASIVGSGEHFFRIVTLNGTTNVYMDDMVTPLITMSLLPTGIQTNTRIVATVLLSGGSIRDLTSWAGSRSGTAPAAGAIPAVQTGLVGYWPLATDGSGTIGPWLSSI